MSPVAPLLRIPVGVVVERRKATSQWVDVVWRPVAVLRGLPDAAPWTPLAGDGETATFFRRSATAKSAGGSRNLPSLNDQVLALATGKTQQEITAACKGARPNHVGAAIARHKRAGRVEERDGKLCATQPTGTVQRVAV